MARRSGGDDHDLEGVQTCGDGRHHCARGAARRVAVNHWYAHGRALDTSGGLLPGVDGQHLESGDDRRAAASGHRRARDLPLWSIASPGLTRWKFQLPSFRVLTVDGVIIAAATATVNGPLQLETLAESIIVTSSTPTIDLQSNDGGCQLERRANGEPAARSRHSQAWPGWSPGLSPTQFDVGGNTVGGSTTTGARSYGRTGGELIKFDGVVSDQFFGDYNTYDQVQVSGAAKGAESQSPGATLSFVVTGGHQQVQRRLPAGLAGRCVPGQQRHRFAPSRDSTRATTSSPATTT